MCSGLGSLGLGDGRGSLCGIACLAWLHYAGVENEVSGVFEAMWAM